MGWATALLTLALNGTGKWVSALHICGVVWLSVPYISQSTKQHATSVIVVKVGSTVGLMNGRGCRRVGVGMLVNVKG